MSASPEGKGFRTMDIQHELKIKAPPEKVWQALTERIGDWWPEKFYVGKAPIRFRLEPHVGGRVFEDWGDGEGALWGTVTSVRINELLQFTADLPIEYGGPGRSITTYRIEAASGASVLKFRDTTFGELHPELQEQMGSGWGFLLKQCFQPYVEKGIKPDRPASVVASDEA